MRLIRLAVTVGWMLLLVGVPAIAQVVSPPAGPKNTSPVLLLPGYQIEMPPGIDAVGGKIWKEGGLTINFFAWRPIGGIDIPEEQVLWREEQKLGDRTVRVVYAKPNRAVVDFGSLRAQFTAQIRNPQDLAELMLMTLTFEPDYHRWYPVNRAKPQPGSTGKPGPRAP